MITRLLIGLAFMAVVLFILYNKEIREFTKNRKIQKLLFNHPMRKSTSVIIWVTCSIIIQCLLVIVYVLITGKLATLDPFWSNVTGGAIILGIIGMMTLFLIVVNEAAWVDRWMRG